MTPYTLIAPLIIYAKSVDKVINLRSKTVNVDIDVINSPLVKWGSKSISAECCKWILGSL